MTIIGDEQNLKKFNQQTVSSMTGLIWYSSAKQRIDLSPSMTMGWAAVEVNANTSPHHHQEKKPILKAECRPSITSLGPSCPTAGFEQKTLVTLVHMPKSLNIFRGFQKMAGRSLHYDQMWVSQGPQVYPVMGLLKRCDNRCSLPCLLL